MDEDTVVARAAQYLRVLAGCARDEGVEAFALALSGIFRPLAPLWLDGACLVQLVGTDCCRDVGVWV